MVKLLVMYSNEPPSTRHLTALESLDPDVAVVRADCEAMAVRHAPDAAVILGHRYLRQALPHTKELKWVQSTAAGIQHLLTPDLDRVSPIVTRCPIFAEHVALHAFALMLAVIRRIPLAVQEQKRGKWARPFGMLAYPKTAMVLGTGSIGSAIARLLQHHRTYVLGVSRSQSAVSAAAFDEILGVDEWRQRLSQTDLLMLALPLTAQTRGLVDSHVLNALPRHAVVIDVGRGGVLMLEALVRLLREGRRGGAGLDVLDPIPVEDDLIWHTPNLLVTPKVSVFHPGRQQELETFIEAQVGRFVRGEELLHRVDIHVAMR
jgi:phosphoglycerate dehydrogenase-like enzyme